ncbi:MAG: hypothetical protein M9962_13710 [Oligoflexia bacterium]|nr:hypothetical protein [Oligoflexia bacterium]
MNSSDIQSEISAQSKLVDSIPIDQAMITEIDRHIKDKEKQLNDRFVYISVAQIIMHFLPPNKTVLSATKVDSTLWDSLTFTKVWSSKRNMHEEISFDKCGKAFAFFYTKGEVLYDIGLVEDYDGVDAYIRIIEDKREKLRVTGASVEVKLQFFRHLKELLLEINTRANDIASRYSEDVTNRYSHLINSNRKN